MAIPEVSPSRAEGAPVASSWTVDSQGALQTLALWWRQDRDNHPASMSLETCQRANDVTLETATHKELFSGVLSFILSVHENHLKILGFFWGGFNKRKRFSLSISFVKNCKGKLLTLQKCRWKFWWLHFHQWQRKCLCYGGSKQWNRTGGSLRRCRLFRWK